jgi:hypothetical protein
MNIPEDTMKYGYARKINADRYIDDRNIGLIGWLLRLYNKERKQHVGNNAVKAVLSVGLNE